MTTTRKPTKAQAMREIRAWAAKHGEDGFDLKYEAKRLWVRMRKYHLDAPLPKIDVALGKIRVHGSDGKFIYTQRLSRSYAYTHERPQRVRLRPFVDYETLAHELAHCADRLGCLNGVIQPRYSSSGSRQVHDHQFYLILREALEKRLKVRISLAEAPMNFGYATDHVIAEQIRHLYPTGPKFRFSWDPPAEDEVEPSEEAA